MEKMTVRYCNKLLRYNADKAQLHQISHDPKEPHNHHFNQAERVVKIFKSSFEETFAISSNAAEWWCFAAEASSNPANEVILKSEYPTLEGGKRRIKGVRNSVRK